MLSPSTSETLELPTNGRPIRNACASPSGLGCTAYSKRTPHWPPSPSSSSKRGRSCGVEMIRISRIPASINAESG